MTLKESIDQIYNLTVNGQINGEHFSKADLMNWVRSLLRVGDEVYFETCLPDGFWYCHLYRIQTGGFDYEYTKNFPF